MECYLSAARPSGLSGETRKDWKMSSDFTEKYKSIWNIVGDEL